MDTRTVDPDTADPRVQRGIALAKSAGAAIKLIAGRTYIVPSATHSGARYIVDVEKRECSCPDYVESSGCGIRPHQCKHLVAVFVVNREFVCKDGTVLTHQVAEGKVYERDDVVTNNHLVKLYSQGPVLIHDLVQGIPLVNVGRRGPGRPPIEPRDIVHAGILKTFEHRTGRGMVEVMARNQMLNLWEREPPHYNTIYEKLADPALMPVLQSMVSASARPFVDTARNFAIDSTGFSTGVYENWNRQKHGTKGEQRMLKRLGKKHAWVKCHACVDVDSLAITAVAITNRRVGDAPMAERLVHNLVKDGFTIEKFMGDAGYVSGANCELIENLNGVPYFMFRKDMNGRSSPALLRLYKRFIGEREPGGHQGYMDEYHDRSLNETVFGILKQMWGGSVAARLPHSMYAEVMCKVVAHNISRIVRAICEFNIEPKFWMPSSPVPAMAPKTVPLLHMKATPAAKASQPVMSES
jgi:hypothetical protein